MNTSESQTSILLKFRAMSAPIAVTVPQHILHYLERHAECTHTPDGRPVYGQPEVLPGAAGQAVSYSGGWER